MSVRRKKVVKRLASGSHARSDLRDLVDTFANTATLLGLTHTTSGYFLREIAEKKKIEPRKCKVFNRQLIYAFYGRAAYRKDLDEETTVLSSVYPVVFVLDPSTLPPPAHVYPFDTGAFANGTFSDFHDPNVILENFELSKSLDSATKIVSEVFETNDKYLSNIHSSHFKIQEPDNFEAKSYEQIIKTAGHAAILTNRAVDDRASAVEVAFNSDIPLDKRIIAAIVPDDLADGMRTGGALKNLGIEVIPYRWTSGAAPKESYELIRDIVRSIYLRKGWM